MVSSSRLALVAIVALAFFIVLLYSSSSSSSSTPVPVVVTPPSQQDHGDSRDTPASPPSSGKRKTRAPSQDQQQDSQHSNTARDEDHHWTQHGADYAAQTPTPTPEQVRAVRQCTPLGSKFARAVAEWLKSSSSSSSSSTPIRRLIYSCEAHRRGKLCGGMGDRFRGMVSSAFLALLSKRRFELFHPVPMPLQSLLRPRFIPWIPTVRKKSSSSTSLQPARSFSELDSHMQDIPLNRALMIQSQNKKIVPFLAPNSDPLDLRIQSNTAGIDKYLLRDPVLKKRFVEELGLPPACNLTCYYGCMYGLLFEPSDELAQEMDRALPKQFTVPAAVAVSPAAGDNTADEDVNARGDTVVVPLSKAVVEVHRGLRPPIPVVGLQLRVGGSWASDFVVREPFRTVPAAFPYVFEDVKFCMCGARPSAAISSSASASTVLCQNQWPVFVTSDSERFVNLTVKELGRSSVYFNPVNSYRHTDTENVHQARPEKWKEVATAQQRRQMYTATLINHVVLAACSSLVFGQSGFADSAFWAARPTMAQRLRESSGRRPAGVGFFMDMTNNRLAWEHVLSYLDEAENDAGEEARPSPAVSTLNRIVDVEADRGKRALLSQRPFLV